MTLPKSKFIFFQIIGFVLCIYLLQSCTKNDTCLSPKVVALRGGFYYVDSIGILHDSIVTNSNFYFGAHSNYVLNMKRNNKWFLPMAQNQDSINFYFQIDSTDFSPSGLDSIQIRYNRKSHFISAACGYETFFEINQIQYSKNNIDTIIMSSTSINNDVNKEHIKIVIKN